MGGMGTTAYPHRRRPVNYELPMCTTTSTGGCGGINVNDLESFFWITRYQVCAGVREERGGQRKTEDGRSRLVLVTVGQGVVVVFHPPPSTSSKGRTYSAPSTTPFCQ